MAKAKDVYPFLGVDWDGNTFVGAALPFGLVKVGPDMEDFDGRASKFGYISGGRIRCPCNANDGLQRKHETRRAEVNLNYKPSANLP